MRDFVGDGAAQLRQLGVHIDRSWRLRQVAGRRGVRRSRLGECQGGAHQTREETQQANYSDQTRIDHI